VECDSDDGGRLASIAWNGRELLTRPHLPGGVFSAPSAEFGEYESRPVFGYDDCWPSLQCSPWDGLGCTIRDHGELCWRKWNLRENNGFLSGFVSDDGQGWVFQRDISARDNLLRFEFGCLNTGTSPLPMHWTGHVLVPPAAIDELHLPDFRAIRQDYPWESDLDLRTPEEVWSHLRGLPEGSATFVILSGLRSRELRIYLAEMDWHWTLVGLENPALGLWYNRRGFPQPEALARDEFGIEWMTENVCSLEDAIRVGKAVILEPGEALKWRMEWRIGWNKRSLTRSKGKELEDETALAVE